jgi:hypothetical protein
MIFNPLFLHLANMVSNDGLFLALSMTSFALILWIIYNPSNKIILWHSIVLSSAFIVRYNALIYPFISVLAFVLSKLSLRKKVFGLGLSVLLIGWFIGLSMYQYKKLTGYWQFSPFRGWLLANNAMYACQEVDRADWDPLPQKFRALDNMIRKFYDSKTNLSLDEISTAYMFTPVFPLMQYPDTLFRAKDTSVPIFKLWAKMGPFYSSYGLTIIKKYPVHFLRCYVCPNSRKYFAPIVEFLGYYNSGIPIVEESAVKWFGYKDNQVKTRMKSPKVTILRHYPFFVCIANFIMLMMLLSYILLKGWQYSPSFNKSILLSGFG